MQPGTLFHNRGSENGSDPVAFIVGSFIVIPHNHPYESLDVLEKSLWLGRP